MDRVISELARYCHDLTFDQLPRSIVRAASERIVDTLGCAVGGLDCEAARIGRRLAPVVGPAGTDPVARPIGTAHRTTTVEAAGFVNAAMIRYLDFNDTFPGGHPSDALGPVMALADAIGASGPQLLTALVAGYDIFIQFAVAAQLRERGWDQGFGVGLATAAGASMLLGLDFERTCNALSISAVSNVPLRATRAGQLSLWKGLATSYAVRNALFGTLLAADGITGPDSPIEGRHGLKELVSGPFELQPFAAGPDSFLTHQARIKFWPVEYHLQAAVWAGIELGKQFDLRELESVEISTYWSAWHETGSEPEKWDPQTRETADHSLPYVLIRLLESGMLDLKAFEPEQYLAPDVRDSMKKVSVRVDNELEALFPETIVMRAVARTTDGREHTARIVNPRGHEANPVTEAEVADKFVRLVEPTFGPDGTKKILAAAWDVANTEQVSTLFDLLVVPDGSLDQQR